MIVSKKILYCLSLKQIKITTRLIFMFLIFDIIMSIIIKINKLAQFRNTNCKLINLNNLDQTIIEHFLFSVINSAKESKKHFLEIDSTHQAPLINDWFIHSLSHIIKYPIIQFQLMHQFHNFKLLIITLCILFFWQHTMYILFYNGWP